MVERSNEVRYTKQSMDGHREWRQLLWLVYLAVFAQLHRLNVRMTVNDELGSM
jgi:hypothetical protein